jgi:hypothetical protein
MLRSLVVPGWGQATNGAWIKAVGIAAGEGTLAVKIVQDRRELRRLDQAVQEARASGDELLELEAVDAYNSRLDRAVSRQWLLGAVVAFALLDAYIDAHFRGFKAEFEDDPALPAGAPSQGKVRLSLRWSF